MARRGRPRQYDVKLTVRVTFEELRHLRPRAREALLSLSRYLVTSGLAGSPPPLTAEERTLRQRAIFHARKIGVNLNQIARQLNSDEPVARDRLTDTLAAAKDALVQLTGRGTR
ncbi:MAG TPA: plasmid mobilization relaxosome protein MobC [Chloroflexota bacterium]|nr:plasmid mobilization relaxosome protein MobC [Chloroflexota bacterium]